MTGDQGLEAGTSVVSLCEKAPVDFDLAELNRDHNISNQLTSNHISTSGLVSVFLIKLSPWTAKKEQKRILEIRLIMLPSATFKHSNLKPNFRSSS